MQEGENRMYLRLDRGLATIEWIDYFKETRVHHIVDSTFDHCALLVTDSFTPQLPKKRRFHFEAMWTKMEDCRNIIEAAWRDGTNLNTSRWPLASSNVP